MGQGRSQEQGQVDSHNGTRFGDATLNSERATGGNHASQTPAEPPSLLYCVALSVQKKETESSFPVDFCFLFVSVVLRVVFSLFQSLFWFGIEFLFPSLVLLDAR